jgi:hypothetical protein
MILLQASFLYTHSLLRGVTFELLPFSSYVLTPTMLPATVGNVSVTRIGEQLSVLSSHFFWDIFNILKSLIPLRHTLFLEIARSYSEPIQGNRVNFFSVIDLWVINCLTESSLWTAALSWCRIQSLGQNSSLFLCIVHVTASKFHIISLVDRLALWD